ncbi:MAG: OsmC family protein [Anaerolineales bacterium]|jgi:putative redox protein|nr:OsmC family protein [Anaerolineales bacterium]HJN40973.1 OsmC family protein [Anaerolineales bacterium]|tara:strand:+ start:1749 stop:2165 length:417 start_codon:yes stop_codon:yes gene_type:complete
MMRAEVRWKEGLDFTGRADSGCAVELASGAAETGSGTSPMELVLIALAGCTAMDVISILQKKRQQVTGFEVRVQAKKTEEHPRVFTTASLEYIVTGDEVRVDAVARAVELSKTKYCSVYAMLKQAMPIEFSYRVQATA